MNESNGNRGQGVATILITLAILAGSLVQFDPIREIIADLFQGGIDAMQIGILAVVIVVALILASAIRIVREYERGVIFRLGRLQGAKGPGLFFLIPVIDKMIKVSLRIITFDIPPQEVITQDNVTVSVNAVVLYRVIDPNLAITEVEDFYQATNQLAQTTLRSVCGQAELDQLLADRERLNQQMQQIIDQHTDPWGIKVRAVEIKDVRIPQDMQRTIGRQAEAERERRAKIINADGEYQAAERLTEAAKVLQSQPAAIQLRYLQTLLDITSEQTSMVIVPLPIELLKAFAGPTETQEPQG